MHINIYINFTYLDIQELYENLQVGKKLSVNNLCDYMNCGLCVCSSNKYRHFRANFNFVEWENTHNHLLNYAKHYLIICPINNAYTIS